MKKQMRTAALGLALAGVLTIGATAATVQKITAELRPDILVEVNGKRETLVDKNGNVVYPMVYEGTTYLPVRALGNLVDMDVDWDGKNQIISLDAKTATRPEDLTLDKLSARVDEVEYDIKHLKSASTYAERSKQYALHSETIDTIRYDLDSFAQKVNQQFRDEEITYWEYNVTYAKLDDLDVRLKEALAKLEAKTIADETDKQTVYEDLYESIDGLENRVKAGEKAVADLKPASAYLDRVEQYNELAGELVWLNSDVTDMGTLLNDYLRQGKLSYQEYNTLSQRVSGLDVRMKAVWNDLAAKTLAKEETQKPANTGTYQGYVDKIAKLDSRVDQLEKEAGNYRPAHGSGNHKQAWKAVERKIDDLDDELDALEDALERDYRDGYLTSAQYRELDKSLDRVDEKLDDLDDWFDWDD